MNGILRNWESLCDIRPDCHHHFDASGTSNAMFDELAERSLMSPLAGTKHTYVRLAIIIYCQILALFFKYSKILGKGHIDHETLHQIEVSGGHQNPYLQSTAYVLLMPSLQQVGSWLNCSRFARSFVSLCPECCLFRMFS